MRGSREKWNRNKRNNYYSILPKRLPVKDEKFLASFCPIAKGIRARGLIRKEKGKKVASYCHKEGVCGILLEPKQKMNKGPQVEDRGSLGHQKNLYMCKNVPK